MGLEKNPKILKDQKGGAPNPEVVVRESFKC
jgi:hypothetical protein